MIPDILIDGISMSKQGWIRESIDFPTPKSQTETVVVPGRNSPIRFTEALGSVSFEPRAFTVVLSMLGRREDFNEKAKQICNQFSGRLAKVLCSEEPELYAVGTLQMTPAYDPLAGRGEIMIECSDGDSYRYHSEETQVVLSGSGTAHLQNDYMPVVPVVVTTADTKLTWKVGTDSFNKTVSAGTWEIPELQLSHGDNSVNVTGSGTTTFRYREGCL